MKEQNELINGIQMKRVHNVTKLSLKCINIQSLVVSSLWELLLTLQSIRKVVYRTICPKERQ